MPVVFDVYMFRPDFIEHMIRKERKKHPTLADDFTPEIGSVFCLNVAREVPIYFFDTDELLDLVRAGIEQAAQLGSDQPKREAVRVEDFPEDVSRRAVLELNGEYDGSLRWEDSDHSEAFNSRTDLKRLVDECFATSDAAPHGDPPSS